MSSKKQRLADALKNRTAKPIDAQGADQFFEPTTKPEKEERKGGARPTGNVKFVTYITQADYEWLDQRSKDYGVSMAAYLRMLLAKQREDS